MVKEYEQRFGPTGRVERTSPISGDVARFDLTTSISSYPRTVSSIIAEAIPWTVGLLGTTTVLSFTSAAAGRAARVARAPLWDRLSCAPVGSTPFPSSSRLILMYCSRAGLSSPMFGATPPAPFPGLTLPSR